MNDVILKSGKLIQKFLKFFKRYDMSKGDIAYDNFLSGLSCTQSVLCAFSEETGLDEESSMKIAMPFGGGMGRMRLTCGAVTGMVMAYGLIFSPFTPPTREEKAAHYAAVRDLSERFSSKTGSVICAELLGLKKAEESYVPEERTEEYYKKRPCPELCRLAANILEDYIKEHSKTP